MAGTTLELWMVKLPLIDGAISAWTPYVTPGSPESPVTITDASLPVKYYIRNLDNLQINMDMPISSFALPEDSKEATIAIKAEGNIESVSLSWVLHDESNSVVSTASQAFTIKTADEQANWLLNTFENKSINQRYKLIIPGTANLDGFITKLNLSKVGQEPVTWRVTMEFLVGDPTIVG